MNDLSMDISRFNLKPEYFNSGSTLHGVNHCYRVMYHCMSLGELLHKPKAAWLAFCAAYIHDLSRLHDGYCTEHGSRAIEEKLPLFLDFFYSLGLSEEDLEAITQAVACHSIRQEAGITDPNYHIIAILKDADALDRIRMGEDDLDVRYLRYNESLELIEFAKRLFYVTDKMEFDSFSQFLKVAEEMG